jgi:serine/threonine-protein kinase
MDEETIFSAALAMACAEQRAAYLDEACAGRAELRHKVEDLLAAHGQAGNFLDRAAAAWNACLPLTDAPPAAEKPGTVIGPYKLLEQIGEGGMGLVFMAEQTQPVRRKVALKVLKPGLDTRQVTARFEAERQALALMDHPNIARILDAGTTGGRSQEPGVSKQGSALTPDSCSLTPAGGRPYFVMELVRGVPITDFCDQRRLTPRQRLELFVTVCQAVQHAHQKGIIHRDLKPTNVLVTLHDTVAVPKVIDFGIAKATSQPLTERTLFTHFAQMVGTPLYMSPEQAEMSGLDVDTRSDVYSLGVLLYELLTGTTPFESETLKKVGLDEMRRIIREEEPPRPSQRVSTLAAEACTTVSERRGVDGRRLGQVLRGELDWIVMKALEKDRNRRYESSSALAADVQRYLRDEPVEACPPSVGYRLRKFTRRNRRGLVMGGVVAASLLAATAVSMWQAAQATEAQHQAEADRRQAETDRKQAESDRDRAKTAEGKANTNLERAKEAEKRATNEAAIARAVNTFFQEDILRQVNSAPQDGMESEGVPNLTVKEALDRASAKVAKRFRGQPVVEAAIRAAIGEAYGSLREYRLAAKHLEQAVKLRQTHLGPDHPETVRSMEGLADAFTWIGRAPEAVVIYERLLAIAKARLGPDDAELLDRMNLLATACRRAGDWQRAMRLLEQLIEKDEILRGPTAAAASDSAHKLAMLYEDAGKFEESAARQEKILALRAGTGGPDFFVMYTCAMAYQRAGKLEQADRLLRQVVEHDRKIKEPMGPVILSRALEVLSLNVLLQDRPVEAEPLAREALALVEKHQTTDRAWRLPYLRNLLGGTLLGQKEYAEAEPLLVQGYEGMKQGEATMTAQWRYRLPEAGERVVRFYEETNQPEKAREWRERLQKDQSKK